MRTGTSAEHLCPLLSAETQLSLEVQETPPKIPTEGPPSTMEASIFRPQGVSGGCSSWVLRGRTSWLHCSFSHLIGDIGSASRPNKNYIPSWDACCLGWTQLSYCHSLRDPGFSGGPQASFLRGETHEATVPTGLNVTHSLPTQVGDSMIDTLWWP